MKFSLVVPTFRRKEELLILFRSLQSQTHQDFEVIISDQNQDERIIELLRTVSLPFPIKRLSSRGGASCGRNAGIEAATGEIICFPDDDCALTPRLLEEVSTFFAQHPEYGFVCGRSFADDGKDSVSRHAKHASEVNRAEVHAQCIEFAIFLRRSALGSIRFDETMGPGAPTPWQADEGPDLLVRLLDDGQRGFYDPRLAVWHPRPVVCFDQAARKRTFFYACGNGHFYRKHRYPTAYFLRQMVRTACGVVLALGTFRPGKARLYVSRLQGRWKGWRTPLAEEISVRSVLGS